jgi:hypothetical protein
MVDAADRLRRPTGPPLTRRPRLGQLSARKMDLSRQVVWDGIFVICLLTFSAASGSNRRRERWRE